jgi:hypothetical protein
MFRDKIAGRIVRPKDELVIFFADVRKIKEIDQDTGVQVHAALSGVAPMLGNFRLRSIRLMNDGRYPIRGV